MMSRNTTRPMRWFLVINILGFAFIAAACRPSAAEQATATSLEATVTYLAAQLTPISVVPRVKITFPFSGQRFQQGQEVEVQYEAIDGQGISHVELLVENEVASANDFIPQPGALFVAKAVWLPERPGTYSLRVRAYNPDNAVGQSDLVIIDVAPIVPDVVPETPGAAQSPPPPSPTRRPTNTPMTILLPPTVTSTPSPVGPVETATPTQPYLIVRVEPGLNVREGPSTRYRSLGTLRPGDVAQILGQNDIGAGRWWQIQFDRAATGLGWVSSSPDYSEAFNTANVAIAAAPPTPTAPPPTPTPTPVPTTEQARIEFGADRTQIRVGECVTVFWNVTNVKEVYYRGQGVSGSNQGRTECPTLTEYYELRVVNVDGTVEAKTIRIEVVGTSFKTAEIDLGEGIDFDRDGKVSKSGDDFKWVQDGDDRRFKKWDDDGDLELVAVGPVEMAVITEADCRWALDNINDRESVRPFAGMAVCFRTDEGRMGKARFEDVDDDADIQWALWK